MKKGMIALVMILISTPSIANDRSQKVDIKQKCDELSKKTGEEYLKVEGKLTHFGVVPPPAGTPKMRTHPSPYTAYIKTNDGVEIETRIVGKWLDSTVEFSKLELAPLPVDLKVGNRFGFCLQNKAIKRSKYRYTVIDYPETITLLE